MSVSAAKDRTGRIHYRAQIESVGTGSHFARSITDSHKGYAARLRRIVGTGNSGRQLRQLPMNVSAQPALEDLAQADSALEAQEARIALLWATLRLNSSGYEAGSTIYHQPGNLAEESAVLDLALFRLQNHRFLTLGVLKAIACREALLKQLMLHLESVDRRQISDSTQDKATNDEELFDRGDGAVHLLKTEPLNT
jgi:hypothetical protein